MDTDRFGCAFENARAIIADGLCAGFAMADADDGPVLCDGLQCFWEKRLPMTPRSRFDIASVGKTFTAALAAQLVAEGLLDPDAPFTDYLPEHVLAKEGCAITARDLATHSSGFNNSKPYEAAKSWQEFLELLFAKRPVRPRGAAFEYSCSNFILLGKIVERLTGLDLDTAARKRLWGPLGMDSTTWNPVEDDGNVVEFSPDTYSGTGLRRIGDHNDLSCHLFGLPLGNGSVFTTIGDMRLFLSDLLHRRNFQKEYYDLLFAESYVGPSLDGRLVRRSFGWDMISEGTDSGIGPGIGFSSTAIAHTGWTGMTAIVDPGLGFAGAFLSNRLGGGIRYKEAKNGRARVLAALAGL